MKPKIFQKKLGLNKNTVAHLSNVYLRRIKGGLEESVDFCVVPLSDFCNTLKFTNCELRALSPDQRLYQLCGPIIDTTDPVTKTCDSCPIPC